MSRLARIKLSGGLQDELQISGRGLKVALTGALLFAGAAVAGATWLGSSLFDVRETVAQAADAAAANSGFSIGEIEVAGISGARAQEVREVVRPEGRHSLLSLDPQEVRARVESLDWVQSARVQRLWPTTLVVEVERRKAYARWREDGEISVIDYNGERLLTERAADHMDLPLVVGPGAGPAAESLLIALEDLPELRSRLKAIVRINQRRWDVELQSGTVIALPEEGAAAALVRIEALHVEHALLDRPLAAIDMRAPGRLAVRTHREQTLRGA
jgi:cell division protein FtsQ